MERTWIDISVAVGADTFVWPTDPRFESRDLTSYEQDAVRVSELRLSAHTGTHMDAPTHYLERGPTIDQLPLDATVGPCVVLDLSSAGQQITAEVLADYEFSPGERLLLRTTNSSRHLYASKVFEADYAHLTPDGAAHLAARGLRCVGIDYLSIGGMQDGDETHRILLQAGIWVIEGLDLRGVEPGDYELVCLPLKLTGLEGAPARAILRHIEGEPAAFIEDAVEWATRNG